MGYFDVVLSKDLLDRFGERRVEGEGYVEGVLLCLSVEIRKGLTSGRVQELASYFVHDVGYD